MMQTQVHAYALGAAALIGDSLDDACKVVPATSNDRTRHILPSFLPASLCFWECPARLLLHVMPSLALCTFRSSWNRHCDSWHAQNAFQTSCAS